MKQIVESTWGYAPADMYKCRWELIQQHLTKEDFVLVDWGSDAGWFSVKVASDFPKSIVISVEAGIMSYGQCIRMHHDKLRTYALKNNRLVQCFFGPYTFEHLHKVPSDYQFVLSVFHHMGDGFGQYLNEREKWDQTFCNLIRGSNVTFFEVPNESNPEETPHRIREWYGDRDIETVIRSALQQGGIQAAVEVLGETEHGRKGLRKLFKISRDDRVRVAEAGRIAEHIRLSGKRIRIRPSRRLRMLASRLLRRVRHGGGIIVRENPEDEPSA